MKKLPLLILLLLLSVPVMAGSIQIVTMPENASVYINGEYYGQSPCSIPINQSWLNNSVIVQVWKSGYHPENKTVFISNTEQSHSITFELTPMNGTLYVNSTPLGASVYVNGTLKGTTPLNLSLRPGSYLINVTKDGSWNSTTVTVKPNETYTVNLTIPKKRLPLTLILGAFTLLAAGGVAVYFAMSKRRRKKSQERSSGVIRSVSPEEVTIVKSSDGRAFGISHVGGRNNNEDNLLILNLPDAYILAVADGLGGHNAGEVASQIAVDTLKETFEQEYKKGMDYEDVKRLLEKGYRLAHERIRENAVGDREGMGTTLVTALVRDRKAIVANTGDSRAYLIRGRGIVERTKDHSLVQELVDKGEITLEEVGRHPMRNVITRALGLDFGLDFYEWELRRGDVLLLSSDGLHDYVSEERILDVVLSGKRAEEIAKKLVEEALPVTRDNVTVVVWG